MYLSKILHEVAIEALDNRRVTILPRPTLPSFILVRNHVSVPKFFGNEESGRRMRATISTLKPAATGAAVAQRGATWRKIPRRDRDLT